MPFEQYLFGICHNRTIDHLRRRRLPTEAEVAEPGAPDFRDRTPAPPEHGPARTLEREDLVGRAEELLTITLVQWVEETWEKGAYERLMVVEALLGAGWRNKQVFERLGLREESVVAGIKLRALRRMKELARGIDSDGVLLPLIHVELDAGREYIDIDVSRVWREQRVSCPSRFWLGRYVAEDQLPQGAHAFLEFHLHRLHCPWCQANLDDITDLHEEDELEPLLAAVQRARVGYVEGLRLRG